MDCSIVICGITLLDEDCRRAQATAMLHTCDGTFKSPCDVLKSCAMPCDVFSNMLVISLPIFEYLNCILSDFQTNFSKMIGILYAFI